MTEYISFEDLDARVRLHPVYADKWVALTDERRAAFHDHIHTVIELHNWLGRPLKSPEQTSQFPRLIRLSGVETVVRWGGDPNALASHSHQSDTLIEGHPERVIPVALLPLAVVELLRQSEQRDLILLRDIGVTRSIVGPITTEFRGQYAGTVPEQPPPIPEPAWTYLRLYSQQNTSRPIGPIHLTRG